MNQILTITHFSDDKYEPFINYCIETSDYFMLVYVKYQMQPYTTVMNEIYQKLLPYIVKTRTNPCWPGTKYSYSLNTVYEVIFYRCSIETKEILLRVKNLFDWTRPNLPQDLSFFRGNACWQYTVGHEKLAFIKDPTEQDIDFLHRIELDYYCEVRSGGRGEETFIEELPEINKL